MAHRHLDEDGHPCGPVVENPAPEQTAFPGINEDPQGVPSRHRYWCDGCSSFVRAAEVIENDAADSPHRDS